MRKVSIIQREIPHYRIRFFEELYAQGSLEDFDIRVYTGSPPAGGISTTAFPYQVLPVRHFGKKKSSSYWMSALEQAIAGSDIVVAPQELQCLTVPYLWAKRRRICKSWIWWGHGYNFQASVHPSAQTKVKEAIKRIMTRRADGLITYTAGGADYWRKQGLSRDRVSPYYNTIDVEGLRKVGSEISEQQRIEMIRTLGLEGKHVLLFSGRLYAEKKVDFLLRAFSFLKRTNPDVGLLILGDGDERQRLESLRNKLALEDVHFLGECIDVKESSLYFQIAELLVMPSLVGLAIVQGFAFGLPLFSTDCPGHGPEFEYLTTSNGQVTAFDERCYANSISESLKSRSDHVRMREAAYKQGDRLFLKNSVRIFIDSIKNLTCGAIVDRQLVWVDRSTIPLRE
jgi:glycosyltransferase involved in cell wall biosynthesis